MSVLICLDKISVDRCKLLHPQLRDEALLILTEASRALSGRAILRFSYTLRTMQEQAKLYAQGRTAPGKIVTNARPGQSFHNYGLAIDIVLIVDGKKAVWDVRSDFDDDKKADWMEVVEVFKRFGWRWGGDFKTFKDMPHFEKTFGKSWKQLIYAAKDRDGYPVL